MKNAVQRCGVWWGWALLVVLLALGYSALRNVGYVGGDDNWELLKIHFAVHQPDQLVRVWNDQPWLHTLLNAHLVRWLGEGPQWPRLFTVVSMAAMWAAIAWMGRSALGFVGMIVAALLCWAWGDGLQLSFSAILEPVAFAWAWVAAAILYAGDRDLPWWRAVCSGAVMGAAMQMKLTSAVVAPGLVLLSLRLYGLRGSLRVGGLWLMAWAATFGLIAWLSPSFRWDWLLGSHWAANQAAPMDPSSQKMSASLLTAETLTPLLAGGFGLLMLRKLGWPPLGVFALGVLLGGAIFKALANLWWYYYGLHFVVPCGVLGGMAVADSVRVLQRHWAGVRAGTETVGDREPALSPQTVAYAVLVLSTVGALCAGVGSGTILKRWTALTRLSYRPDPILVQHLRIAAASNEVCYASVVHYHELLVAGVFPLPELLILPLKRFLSGQITWAGVAELLESNRVPLLLLDRQGELAQPEFVRWLKQRYALTEVQGNTEVWRRVDSGEVPHAGVETRLGRP